MTYNIFCVRFYTTGTQEENGIRFQLHSFDKICIIFQVLEYYGNVLFQFLEYVMIDETLIMLFYIFSLVMYKGMVLI